MDILVADDDAKLREALTELLEGQGHHVEVAADGREALRRLTSGSFHVAFVDLVMPGIGGFEVLHDAARACPRTAIVLMTGHGRIGNAVEAMKAGASDFVEKPFELATIERLLEDVQRRVDVRQGALRPPPTTPPRAPGDILAAYLTTRGGLLIASRTRSAEMAVDQDLFVGTLDVIQNFMRTSFPMLRGRQLETIRQGDRMLLLDRGAFLGLTVLLRGEEGPSLRARMREVLRELEARNAEAFRRGQVLPDQVVGAEEALARLMGARETPSA